MTFNSEENITTTEETIMRPSFNSEKKVSDGVISLMRRPKEIVKKVIVAPETVKYYTSLCKVKQTGNRKAPKSDFARICHKISKQSLDKDAQLAADEELGDTSCPLAKVVSRWSYKLTTEMCVVHQWYLEKSKDSMEYLPIRCRDEDIPPRQPSTLVIFHRIV